MKKLDEVAEHLLENLLVEQFTKSKFESISVTDTGKGIDVEMKGELFGLVGALGTATANLASISKVPLSTISFYVETIAKFVSRREHELKQEREELTPDELINNLNDLFKSEEGEK